jgi:Cft2 family RNA processing exonuclease
MELIARGGAREVGRSCAHLTVENRDYLIDCGLKQSHPTSYPDFTGLALGQIDAVFLTHAHIDHTGALPLCEARGLLADDAPIIATRSTGALAHILLWDSFKIHTMEMAERNQPQRYTEDDVQRTLERFDGVPYGSDARYNIEYQFSDAGHLMRLQIAGLDSLAVIVCRTLGRLREQGFDFIIESVVEIRRDIVIRELFFDC